MSENKYSLLGTAKEAKEAEKEIDEALTTFLNALLAIEKKYPEVGLSDSDVRDSVCQELVNRFP